MSTTLNCKGSGREPIIYQWEYSLIDKEQWKSISDSNTEKLVIRNLQQSEKYRCLVSNQAGRTVSNTSTVILMGKLFIQIDTICIDVFTTEITTQPVSPTTVIALEDVTLNCLASVDDVIYSWHRVSGSVPSKSIGLNSSTLIISKVTPYDKGLYYCIAKRKGISVQSNKAIVRVNGNKIAIVTGVLIIEIFADLLTIIIIPNNLSIGKGKTAEFNTKTSGIGTKENNFIYQWRKRGSNGLPDKASGSNGTVLTIPNVLESDEGQYYCTITNEWGRSVKSDDVTLTVYGMLATYS